MKTILYHAITTYHLLEFIVHSMYFHKKDHTILLIPKSLANYYPNYTYLTENNIISEVIIMPDIVTGKSEDDIIEKIKCFVDSNMAHVFQNGIEIHLAGGQFMFSAYLIKNNIPFIFYEEASGILSRIEKLKENVKIGNPLMYEIANQNNMFDGTNELVTYRVCNKSAQLPDFPYDKNIYDFDIVNTLKKMDVEEVQQIISFFTNILTYDVEENSTLVLTQHFANLSTLTYEQQVLLYQTLCDYFLEEDSLVFKPHPFDFINYDAIFKNAKVIRERFPSELLPFMFSKRPHRVATISSTSIFTIRDIFDSSFELDFDFEKDFTKMSRYYAMQLLTKELLEKNYHINFVGINTAYYNYMYANNTLTSLYNSYSEIKEIIPNQIYVIDEEIENHDIDYLFEQNIGTIFLDSHNKKDFYRYKYRNEWNCADIYMISKKVHSNENVYTPTDNEILYVFGKIKGEIKMEKTEKELQYTGVKLSIEKMNNNTYDIMALEGKLAATENRLLYYINKSKQLEERIQNLKEKGYPIA